MTSPELIAIKFGDLLGITGGHMGDPVRILRDGVIDKISELVPVGASRRPLPSFLVVR